MRKILDSTKSLLGILAVAMFLSSAMMLGCDSSKPKDEKWQKHYSETSYVAIEIQDGKWTSSDTDDTTKRDEVDSGFVRVEGQKYTFYKIDDTTIIAEATLSEDGHELLIDRDRDTEDFSKDDASYFAHIYAGDVLYDSPGRSISNIE